MPTLLVFLKYPAAGQVKTRLAVSIGPERAAELYREWVGLVLARLEPLRGAVRIIGCFDGAPQAAFAPWDKLVDEWWPQPAGDLGRRLQSGFETWQAGDGRIAAIGTDCLDIDAALLQSAFCALEEADVVFGPTLDGGYYLLGAARRLPGLFDGVPWSTTETLTAHAGLCRQHGWSVEFLPTLRDIDTWEDWLEYNRHIRNRSVRTGSAICDWPS
jgi:uncharacterized protein